MNFYLELNCCVVSKAQAPRISPFKIGPPKKPMGLNKVYKSYLKINTSTAIIKHIPKTKADKIN